MRHILAALTIILAPAFARSEPLGCYVSFANPSQCATGAIECGGDLQANYDAFGPTIGAMCDFLIHRLDDLNVCNAGFNALEAAHSNILARLSDCEESAAATEANRQEWITYGNTQAGIVAANAKLIKKLRKKCGVACKKVR